MVGHAQKRTRNLPYPPFGGTLNGGGLGRPATARRSRLIELSNEAIAAAVVEGARRPRLFKLNSLLYGRPSHAWKLKTDAETDFFSLYRLLERSNCSYRKRDQLCIVESEDYAILFR
jgi:hypothetical protein